VRSPAGGGPGWSPRATPTGRGVLGNLDQAIGELPEGAVVLAEDETHVNLLPWVRATWIAHGTRQQVMTPGANPRRTIFGAVDLHSGRFLYQIASKALSASFTAFLEQLLAAYPAAPLVAVVCDNVIIHHSKLVQRWLAAHPRVVVLHGARYSPMTTRLSGSGPRSRPGRPTARRPQSKGASARCTPTSVSAAPPSCWPPPLRPAHHGYPRVHTELPGGRFRRARERAGSIPKGPATLAPKTPPPSPMWSIPPYLQRSKPPGGRQ
jgi:DDE superfamily endonuclease